MYVPNRFGMFTDEEILEAKENNKMLSIGLNLSNRCDLRCVYCFNESGRMSDDELKPYEIDNLLRQCIELGLKEIVIPGAGEPLLSPYLLDIIRVCGKNGIRVEVFTNGYKLTDEHIACFDRYNTCVSIKLNSLKNGIQDYLSWKLGYSKVLYNSIDRLIEAGLTKKYRLTTSNQITKLNYNEIPDYYRYCRERQIIPKVARLMKKGRALKNWDYLSVSEEETKNMFSVLKNIDKNEYGYEWYDYNPNFSGGYGCRLMYYSPFIDNKGYFSPCLGRTDIIGNIKDKTLLELWNDPKQDKYKNIDKYLSGECTKCDNFKKLKCYSCVNENLVNNNDPFISYRKCI